MVIDMRCQRGFGTCYDVSDISDAIIDVMCIPCPKYDECNAYINENYDESEDECIHIEQIVTCIYNKFKGDNNE